MAIPRDRQIFVVENGPDAGREVLMPFGHKVVIGRAHDADLRVDADDGLASRHHVEVISSAAGLEVRDLGSRNGTFVNGRQVTAAILRPGDRLRVGRTVYCMIHPGARTDPRDIFDVGWIEDELSRLSTPGVSLSRVGSLVPVPGPTPVGAGAALTGCDGSAGTLLAPLPPPYTGAGWLCDGCAAVRRKRSAADPSFFGRFEVLRAIGGGGMSLVYEGRDRSCGAHAALKTLRPDLALDAGLTERFLREQRRAIALVHPHIVRSFDVGQDQATGALYIATEWLAGGDASELGSPRFSQDLAFTLGADLFEAIAYLQAHGLVHRDIKPENLLLAPPGRAKIAGKLADFGIARNLRDAEIRLTADDAMAGTPLYAAPEQLLDFKWVGHTADIYGGAATLYYLLTGATPLVLPLDSRELPHVAVYTAALGERRMPAAQRRPDAPRAVCEWLDAALARDPAEREKMDPAHIAAWLRELAG